tara:strand:+ start:205 stop:477 length:273 start_codon:yes stop_codon:yes gene_type:complete
MSQSNTENLLIYNARKASSATMWILFLFLGWSYGSLGSMVKQIFYYLTLGGLGLWALYRLFTLNGAIKKYNRKIATEIGLSAEDILKLGL